MAWSQTDLEKLDRAIAAGVKSVTYADGRRVDYHDLGQMRALRKEMKAELAAAGSQVNRLSRTTIARMGRR